MATQNPWLVHGLDPVAKAERCAVSCGTLRKELTRVSAAVGVPHRR
ncbi:hypothetical protein [Nocardioides kongjuensis]